jgi:microcystin-dependent protein
MKLSRGIVTRCSISNIAVWVISAFALIRSTDSMYLYPSVFPTGTIVMYAKGGVPPLPWLLCDGREVSREEYQNLFLVINETYGPGDHVSTFNLPDLRGRVAVGVDSHQSRTQGITFEGATGGSATHVVNIGELPSHAHGIGGIVVQSAGDHSHTVNDPGHNHGGKTGPGDMGFGSWPFAGLSGGHGNDWATHTHSIPVGQTGITLQNNGGHKHALSGATDAVGGNNAIPLLQPFQAVNYIICAA